MTDSTILQPEGLEQRYERYKEKIKHFTIMNDIFMRNVLKEISCTEYILQVIMNRTGLKVIDQTLQKDYKNLQGRSQQPGQESFYGGGIALFYQAGIQSGHEPADCHAAVQIPAPVQCERPFWHLRAD